MKLFITALLTLTIISLSAQEGFVPKVYELSKAPKQKIQNHKPQIPNSNKSPGDTIFYEDFDSVRWGATCSSNYEPVPENAPDGYSLVDNTGNNFHWRWSDRGPRGAYSGGCAFPATDPLYSTSGDNGFLLFEADWYNSTDDCTLADPYIHQDAYVQFSSIDFSDYDFISLRFEEMYRFCCAYNDSSNALLQFSVDQGRQWVSFDVTPIQINQYTLNPEVAELALTSLLANEPNVSFRFYMFGLSHYHWEIDDILFFQPFEYDLRLNDYWNDYLMQTFPTEDVEPTNDFYGGFYSQPWFVMQPYVGFRGAVENFGSEVRSNVQYLVDFYRYDSLIARHKSNPVALQPEQKDTLAIDFANTAESDFYELFGDTAWRVNRKGKYSVKCYHSEDIEDDMTNNDTLIRLFVIGDSVICYAHTNEEYLTGSVSAIDIFPWSYRDVGLGIEVHLPDPNAYNIDSDTSYYVLSSVSTYLTHQTSGAIDLINEGGAKFKVFAYQFNDETEEWEEILSSATYVININDTCAWINIPFVEASEYKIFDKAIIRVNLLFIGNYMTDRRRGVLIGDDVDRKTNGKYSCKLFTDDYGDGWSDHTPAIALNMHYNGEYPYPGIGDANYETLNSKIYPNPNTGTFTIEVGEKATATISNAIGTILDVFEVKEQQTVTVDYQPGVYFVQLKSKNRQAVHRLIIE